jgi:wobble nucleotide-excising tRNase
MFEENPASGSSILLYPPDADLYNTCHYGIIGLHSLMEEEQRMRNSGILIIGDKAVNDEEKEARRKKKLEAEAAEQLAKDEIRKKAYLAREQIIVKEQKARELREADRRASEDIKNLAREKARKEAYLAQEEAHARDLEARTLKDNKQAK